MVCRGLDCTSEKLIKAHIFPQAFARLMRGPEANVKMTSERVSQANPQLGEYDPNILCEKCDNWLGKNDDYAADVCQSFEAAHVADTNDIFEMTSVDCERFSKFVLSVLWRASISSRIEPVKLGPYENVARDILFDARKLSDVAAFEILVQRYRSKEIDTSRLYFHPVRQPFLERNAYGFGLGGFRIITKVDQRPLPGLFQSLIISRSNRFRGTFIEFENTTEFETIAEMIRGNAQRDNSHVWKTRR